MCNAPVAKSHYFSPAFAALPPLAVVLRSLHVILTCLYLIALLDKIVNGMFIVYYISFILCAGNTVKFFCPLSWPPGICSPGGCLLLVPIQHIVHCIRTGPVHVVYQEPSYA